MVRLDRRSTLRLQQATTEFRKQCGRLREDLEPQQLLAKPSAADLFCEAPVVRGRGGSPGRRCPIVS